jgi:lyso-ornithine lipid O-acyltransferase
VKNLRPIGRFLFFAAYTAIIVAEIWLKKLFLGEDIHRAMRIRQRWAKNLLPGIGVRLEIQGEPPQYPCLIISNHRSYLDPILMLQHLYAYPVAKAELAKWPLIGNGAAMAGILYLKRENARSRAGTLQAINKILGSGFQVIIFPEGTTSGLQGTLPLKRGVFQLAAKMQHPIVPVALVFEKKEDFWVGKESFLSHARRRFKEKEIKVALHYGPKIQGESHETLLHDTKAWIDAQLQTHSA